MEEEGHRGQQDHRGFVSWGPPNFGEMSKVAECFVKVDFVLVLFILWVFCVRPLVTVLCLSSRSTWQDSASQLSPLGRQEAGTKIMNK